MCFQTVNNILCGSCGYSTDSFLLLNLWFSALESKRQGHFPEDKCKR